MAAQQSQTPSINEAESRSPSNGATTTESTTQSQSESSSSSNPPPTTSTCAHCQTPSTDPDAPKPVSLKPCAKCQSARYCSRDCQKADFKKHKKVCASLAQIYAQTADLRPAAPPRVPKEGHRGGLQKWQFDT